MMKGSLKHVPGVYPEDDVEKWFYDTAPQCVERRKHVALKVNKQLNI